MVGLLARRSGVRTGRSVLAHSIFRRSGLFTLGVLVLSLGVSLILASHLGAAPFDAFVTGVAKQLHISVGTGYYVVGAGFVGISWALGRRPKLGTLVCVAIVGLVVNEALSWLGPLLVGTHWALRTGVSLGGDLLLVLGAVAMVLANVGAGLVEELMLAVHGRGISVREARWGLEAACLVGAWLSDGQIGPMTVVIVIVTGPLITKVLALGHKRLVGGEAVTYS